jgi:uncharacterized protein (DUF1499 family)
MSNMAPEEAIALLATIIGSESGASVVSQDKNYIYTQFTSSLMGFVDDVEFFKATQEEPIQIKSASRVGYSDLGVNRKRLEKIRAKFAAQGK